MRSAIRFREQPINIDWREQVDPPATKGRNALATKEGSTGLFWAGRSGDGEAEAFRHFLHREPASVWSG
jgi:hypothetical protein